MSLDDGDATKFLKDRELSYLLRSVRVNFTETPKDDAEGEEENFHGAKDLPRWQAEVYAEEGLAQIDEESFETELAKTASRERIQGKDQIATLNPDFYLKMRRHLAALKAKADGNGANMDDYRRTNMVAYDLLTIRVGKILRFAASSSIPQDLLAKITPEEKLILEHVHSKVDGWRKAVLDGVP